MTPAPTVPIPKLTQSQIEDLRLGAAKLSGAKRRAFQAAMTLKYCEGKARRAESVFGWNRKSVELGLVEHRTQMTCKGKQSEFSGNKRWEERYPDAGDALRRIAEAHAQQDPTFKSTIAYTRLTSAEALRQLKNEGFPPEKMPGLSTMAVILNRMGYRLRKVVKAKPQKNFQKPT
jgi:hypothetical protein